MRIYKYLVDVDLPRVMMPSGAKILHLAPRSHNTFWVWAAVEEDRPEVEHCFRVFGTGHEITLSLERYLGTVHCEPFVWHVLDAQGIDSERPT